MALNDLLKSVAKQETSYVTGALDTYLIQHSLEANDRAIDVNAPSQIGKCMRSNFYARTQVSSDGSIDARLQRIFDNGTKTHERLQEYLTDMGILLCDEVPLINEEYNIQGHTDGILDLGNGEIGILEIKSINAQNYSALKDAKEEHKEQGLIYLYCLEERRKYLQRKYGNLYDMRMSRSLERLELKKRYSHIKSGRKHSAKEKIDFQLYLHDICDDILIDTEIPVTKVIFLYENKNTQELKEFVVERNVTTEHIISDILSRCETLNDYVIKREEPPREGSSKSCNVCRWCNYKNHCWIV